MNTHTPYKPTKEDILRTFTNAIEIYQGSLRKTEGFPERSPEGVVVLCQQTRYWISLDRSLEPSEKEGLSRELKRIEREAGSNPKEVEELFSSG